MAKPQLRYVCQSCGSAQPKWMGQCPDCGEWNTLSQEAAASATPFAQKHSLKSGGRVLEMQPLDAVIELPKRLPTGFAELDRALDELRLSAATNIGAGAPRAPAATAAGVVEHRGQPVRAPGARAAV